MVWSRSLARKWQSWQQLDSSEQYWFLGALVLFPLVRLSLKLRNLRSTQKTLAELSPLKDVVNEYETQFVDVMFFDFF